MISEIHLLSYAKVNLSLRILGIREDRFHEIESLMQSVSLCDEISITSRDSGIEVFCDDPRVPANEGNIAHEAATAFFSFTRRKGGASITIKKSIPSAAGLAGGSSNAAATLVGLDTLYNAKLSTGTLASLGKEIGSDVPFCLVGGRCRVRGRGELVEQLHIIPKMWFVIVMPDIEVNTKWAYEEYDRWKLKVTGVIGDVMRNDFEDAISSKYPVIREIKAQLLNAGAISSSMSGSGPAVYGICDSEGGAMKIAEEMKKHHSKVFSACSVNYGVKIV